MLTSSDFGPHEENQNNKRLWFLMPPAVDTGPAPINISPMFNAMDAFPIASAGIILKPAIRADTD